jgi:hypothetical protein
MRRLKGFQAVTKPALFVPFARSSASRPGLRAPMRQGFASAP